MVIGSIGYNYTHGPEFAMDRPNGPGCWLFLIVKTPAYFVIGGKEYNVKKNSVVIFSPNTSCYYRAASNEYTDDWMYFNVDEGDEERFGELGIKTNEPITLRNVDELSRLMHEMTYERYSSGMYNEEIGRRYADILFYKLSNQILSPSDAQAGVVSEKNYRFTQLRTTFYTDPISVTDIDTMADELGMSRSGFQHLYKKMFGVSVMTDVINGRLDRATRLLSSTNLTVKEIAERCGYISEYNFMRQFKSRFGKTPTEYRKCI